MLLRFGLAAEEHSSAHQLDHPQAQEQGAKEPDDSVQADEVENEEEELGGGAFGIDVDWRGRGTGLGRDFPCVRVTLEKTTTKVSFKLLLLCFVHQLTTQSHIPKQKHGASTLNVSLAVPSKVNL